jgi:hypothetical protein
VKRPELRDNGGVERAIFPTSSYQKGILGRGWGLKVLRVSPIPTYPDLNGPGLK